MGRRQPRAQPFYTDSTGTCTDHMFRPRGAALRGGYCYASFLPHILTPEYPIRTSLIRQSPHLSAVFQRVPACTPRLALRTRVRSSGHVTHACARVIDAQPLERAIACGLPPPSLPDDDPVSI